MMFWGLSLAAKKVGFWGWRLVLEMEIEVVIKVLEVRG